jgi:hypothetical protein
MLEISDYPLDSSVGEIAAQETLRARLIRHPDDEGSTHL